MPADLIASLEALLAKGQEGVTVRFALATRYLAVGDPAAARRHAEAAVALDPGYSAGWKVLGQARAAAGDGAGAHAAYTRGIEVAEARGDLQAAKEMRVFRKRLEKAGRANAAGATGDGGGRPDS